MATPSNGGLGHFAHRVPHRGWNGDPARDCRAHGWEPRESPAKVVFSAFLFSNELEMLLVRLHGYDGVVASFVLVESNTTTSNASKPLWYTGFAELHDPRFRRFRSRIHAYVAPPPLQLR